jgi:hypothetical protein
MLATNKNLKGNRTPIHKVFLAIVVQAVHAPNPTLLDKAIYNQKET